MMRRHGWQRPLHPLQIVGMAVYSFIVVNFYVFLGLFLGNKIAEITVVTLFSIVAFGVMVLFIRCTAIDPTDTTSVKKRKRTTKLNVLTDLNYGFILGRIVSSYFRRIERKVLKCFIRRKYLDPWKTNLQAEPLLPFLLVFKDDAVAPDLKDDDTTFCSLCDFEVKKHSKHCRTCNRCVEGFDHHCRWLNNCIGKKNYTCFFLLMIFVLLLLIIEGGTAVAIFIRCFADKNGIEQELLRKLHIEFPRGVLAGISIVLVLMMAYGSAALGQLFFFHVVLIRKGMRTYDYILAMKEENNRSMEMHNLDDLDFSSDDSSEFDSPEKPSFISRFICREPKASQEHKRLSIRIDKEPETTAKKKPGFRASIDPWKLIEMSREKALLAAEMAKERIKKQKPALENHSLSPLQLETKRGMMMNSESETGTTPVMSRGWSPRVFSSPRRRFSWSATPFPSTTQQNYRSSFDVKLTEASQEFENYISKQVACSVMMKDRDEPSSSIAHPVA